MVTIRDYRHDDAAALVPLLEELGHPTEVAPVWRRVARIHARGVRDRILLATDECSDIGLLTLHFTPVIHRDSEVGRVTALVVARRARRLGVGALLMAEAERIVQRAGATRVELTSGHDRPEAHAFYLRLGYHDEGVRFAKVFDWQPAGEESSRA